MLRLSESPPSKMVQTGSCSAVDIEDLSTRGRCECSLGTTRRSRALRLASVFTALMLDGILWTVVVPILPTYIHDLETAKQTTSQNPSITATTQLVNHPQTTASTTDDVDDVVVQPVRRFALADDSFYDWIRDAPDRRNVHDSAAGRFWDRWLERNWTGLPPNGTATDDDYEQLAVDDGGGGRAYQSWTSGGRESEPAGYSYQHESSRLGWLYASKAILQLTANPIVGFIVSRYGYAFPLISGVVILLASCTLYAIGGCYGILVAARATHGVGSSCLTIAGMASLAMVYVDQKDRSQAMGVALGGLGVGILVGYPFGGLANEFPDPRSMPFVTTGLAALLLLVLLTWISTAPGTPFIVDSALSPQLAATPIFVMLRDPYILIAAWVMFLAEMSMATIEPTVPSWMLDTMNPEKWQLGTVFVPDSIGFFVGCSLFGLVTYKLGPWRVAFVSLLVGGVSLFMIPFATRPVHLIGPHFGFGLSLGLMDVSIMPLLAHLVDTRHTADYGSVYAIAQVAISLGFAVGPALGGEMVKLIGFPWLFRGLAMLSVACAPLCCYLRNVPCKEELQSILMKENGGSSMGSCNGRDAGQQSRAATNAAQDPADKEIFGYRPLDDG